MNFADAPLNQAGIEPASRITRIAWSGPIGPVNGKSASSDCAERSRPWWRVSQTTECSNASSIPLGGGPVLGWVGLAGTASRANEVTVEGVESMSQRRILGAMAPGRTVH